MDEWLSLIYLQGFTLNQKRFLVRQFGSAGAVIGAPSTDLVDAIQSAGEHDLPVERIKKMPKPPAMGNVLRRDMALLHQHQATFIPFTDAHYPSLLNEIHGAPLGLFCIGNTALLQQSQLAIVGSRRCSRSGLETAKGFATAAGEARLVVTSGMALGIDSAAHYGALEANHPTIAVMATGIDKIYPPRNVDLYREICTGGLVVSEYPPTTPPRRHYFPQRNRIISGLCRGTLVIKAGVRSGSLITARLAAEQGREVFAVPGSIHTLGSRGCHYLLCQGAALVESFADIAAELSIDCKATSIAWAEPNVPLPTDLADVYGLIDYSPCPIDKIIALSGLTADQVSSILFKA